MSGNRAPKSGFAAEAQRKVSSISFFINDDNAICFLELYKTNKAHMKNKCNNIGGTLQ